MLLKAANLTWQDKQVYSPDYDDIYFTDHSQDGGISEVQRFFLEPCRIAERAINQPLTTVGELGFGSGLNFAVTAHAFLHAQSQVGANRPRLHFISFEAHPLSFAHWQRVAEKQADNLTIYTTLATYPPPTLPGWHQRYFADGQITLSVYHGDVSDGLTSLLSQQQQSVDAWYLDGFAPDKNPAMWDKVLFKQMAKLSTSSTIAATFTAAGHVKRGLQEAGFEVSKHSRTPIKREAIVARFTGSKKQDHTPPSQVKVIGAGIGGAYLAHQLAQQNIQVQVVDQAREQKLGGSHIRQAVMHARLLQGQDPQAALRAHAFHHAVAIAHGLPGVAQVGVLQCQGPNLDLAKLQRVADSYHAQDPAQHYWIKLVEDHESELSLWFAQGCVVDIPVLVDRLLHHPNIEIITQASSSNSIAADEVTVLCNGYAAQNYLPWLEIAPVGGQLDHFLTTPQANAARVGKGYCVSLDNTLTLGASYEYTPWQPDKATQHNLTLNQHHCADLPLEPLGVTRGNRAICSDRLPVVGQVQENLWIATGLGSMGTTLAPFTASIISAALCGHVAPGSTAITAQLRPQRFKERQARRGLRHGAT